MVRASHAPRRRWRAAPVLVALCVSAAACSSSKPQGTVGTTLAAMNGTVTLDKVFYPAPVESDSPGFAPLGHQLAAVVLTVHSPTTAAAKFSDIYGKSQLFDSRQTVHLAKSTAKYKISECLAYSGFATVPAGSSATGCEIFVLSAAATPTALQISGKAKGRWTIPAADIQPGTTGPAAGGAPSPSAGVPTPTTLAPGPLSSTSPVTSTAVTGSTVAPVLPSGSGTTPTTAAPASASASPHHGRRRSPALHVKINSVSPTAGFAGLKVTIYGRGLGHAYQITFGGVPGPIRKLSPARLVVIVPVGATSGPVVVTTPLGAVTSPKNFQVY